MIFHTGLLCLMQAVSVVFSDEICNNIQRKSKATLQSSEKSTPVFYVFTVSDSNVTRYVIENNKFLTSTDRPIRNANQPINVGLKLVITSILKVVCWLSFVYLFCTSNLFSLDRMNLMKEFSYEVMF